MPSLLGSPSGMWNCSPTAQKARGRCCYPQLYFSLLVRITTADVLCPIAGMCSACLGNWIPRGTSADLWGLLTWSLPLCGSKQGKYFTPGASALWRCSDSWRGLSSRTCPANALNSICSCNFLYRSVETSIPTSYSGGSHLHFSCKTMLCNSKSSTVQMMYQHSTICPTKKENC